ncbi:MAG: alpha/beta hydrolase-fold protein [Opitutaceae bacterium]
MSVIHLRKLPLLIIFLGVGAIGLGSASAADPDTKDPNTWKWNDPRDLGIPGLRHGTIESASMGRTVGFNIYLPPQYDKEPGRRFPVVYFLHGTTGTESSDAGLARNVDAAISSGRIAPVIYVFPNGGAASYYRDWPENYVRAETMLIHELLPFIDQHYRTIDRSSARGICGFSMGGSGAIRLVLKYPGLFCTAASLAAAIDKTPEDFGGDNCYRHASELTQKQRDSLYLFMVIGGDDFLLPRQEPFLKHLKDLGIRYTYVVHSNVGHNLGKYTELSGQAMIEHMSRELSKAEGL